MFKRQQDCKTAGSARILVSLFPFFEPILVTMVAVHAVGRTASLWRPHLSTWQDTVGMVMLPLCMKTWDHTPKVDVCVWTWALFSYAGQRYRGPL